MSRKKFVDSSFVVRIASRSALVKNSLSVTSRPITVTSAPLPYSSSAASGSQNTFASAAGLTFPFTRNAPPRCTTRNPRFAIPGSNRIAIATFVADASAMTVTSLGSCAFTVSTMNSAAVLPGTAVPRGFDRRVFPNPSSPWTKSAMWF
eukprot:31311-Pelagococcus_subviridis.AAC.8